MGHHLGSLEREFANMVDTIPYDILAVLELIEEMKTTAQKSYGAPPWGLNS